jgi:hypothetical protein
MGNQSIQKRIIGGTTAHFEEKKVEKIGQPYSVSASLFVILAPPKAVYFLLRQ